MICYDFVDDKRRARFAKFLKKYGHMVQYSVYSIENSKRVLTNITTEIELRYKKFFGATDHILIFPVCEACKAKVVRYGCASHEVEDVVYF